MFQTINGKLKSSISSINLYTNILDDNCINSLGKLLENNETLENIRLGGEKHNITDKGINELSFFLFGNNKLRFIDFSWNKGITANSLPIFKEITEKSNIEAIDIRDTQTSFQSEYLFLFALNKLKNGSIQKLNFSHM